MRDPIKIADDATAKYTGRLFSAGYRLSEDVIAQREGLHGRIRVMFVPPNRKSWMLPRMDFTSAAALFSGPAAPLPMADTETVELKQYAILIAEDAPMFTPSVPGWRMGFTAEPLRHLGDVKTILDRESVKGPLSTIERWTIAKRLRLCQYEFRILGCGGVDSEGTVLLHAGQSPACEAVAIVGMMKERADEAATERAIDILHHMYYGGPRPPR